MLTPQSQATTTTSLMLGLFSLQRLILKSWFIALWWLFFVTWSSSSSDSSECFKTRKKSHVNLAFLAASYLTGVQVPLAMLEIRYKCTIIELVIILWLVLLSFRGVGFSLYESLILIFLVSAFLHSHHSNEYNLKLYDLFCTNDCFSFENCGVLRTKDAVHCADRSQFFLKPSPRSSSNSTVILWCHTTNTVQMCVSYKVETDKVVRAALKKFKSNADYKSWSTTNWQFIR